MRQEEEVTGGGRGWSRNIAFYIRLAVFILAELGAELLRGALRSVGNQILQTYSDLSVWVIAFWPFASLFCSFPLLFSILRSRVRPSSPNPLSISSIVKREPFLLLRSFVLDDRVVLFSFLFLSNLSTRWIKGSPCSWQSVMTWFINYTS